MATFHESSAEGGEVEEKVRTNFEQLRDYGWTSLSSPEDAGRRQDDQILLINKYPRARLIEAPDGQTEMSSDPAVVAAAYYGLELATKLKPFTQLLTPRPGSGSKYDEIKFKEGVAIARELIAASKLYAGLRLDRRVGGEELHRLQRNVAKYTADLDGSNTLAFRTLKAMGRFNASRPSLSSDVVKEAEQVLRMFIAKERGQISDYADLLKITFPAESDQETEIPE